MKRLRRPRKMNNDNHTVKLKTEVTCPNCGEEIEVEAEAKLQRET